MNESLAKQLHDLILHAKWGIEEAVTEELHDLKIGIDKLIENKTHEEI